VELDVAPRLPDSTPEALVRFGLPLIGACWTALLLDI
jgi:hypothetical protein